MKKVNKASIIQRLAARFWLQETGERQAFQMEETIIPVTNTDELIRSPAIQYETTTGTSLNSAWTVPSGKRWKLKGLSLQRVASGSNSIYVANPLNSFYFYFISDKTGTNEYFQADIVLEQGWTVNIQSGNGTSNDITHGIIYEEEDSY